MNTESTSSKALLLGALLGAFIGAGAAYILVKAPSNVKPGDLVSPIKPKDLLDITKTLTNLIGQLDDVRRKT